MPWNAATARARSLTALRRLGLLEPPEHFPLIEASSVRPQHDVEDRALALNVVLAFSFGMPLAPANAWLKYYSLSDALTPRESRLLEDEATDEPGRVGCQVQVEAAFVLAWALGLSSELDWVSYCPDDLYASFPDLRRWEDTTRFRDAASLRAGSEVLDELDFAYCLSWGVREASLSGAADASPIQPYAVWERRRALEWLAGDDWDDPDLST